MKYIIYFIIFILAVIALIIGSLAYTKSRTIVSKNMQLIKLGTATQPNLNACTLFTLPLDIATDILNYYIGLNLDNIKSLVSKEAIQLNSIISTELQTPKVNSKICLYCEGRDTYDIFGSYVEASCDSGKCVISGLHVINVPGLWDIVSGTWDPKKYNENNPGMSQDGWYCAPGVDKGIVNLLPAWTAIGGSGFATAYSTKKCPVMTDKSNKNCLGASPVPAPPDDSSNFFSTGGWAGGNCMRREPGGSGDATCGCSYGFLAPNTCAPFAQCNQEVGHGCKVFAEYQVSNFSPGLPNSNLPSGVSGFEKTQIQSISLDNLNTDYTFTASIVCAPLTIQIAVSLDIAVQLKSQGKTYTYKRGGCDGTTADSCRKDSQGNPINFSTKPAVTNPCYTGTHESKSATLDKCVITLSINGFAGHMKGKVIKPDNNSPCCWRRIPPNLTVSSVNMNATKISIIDAKIEGSGEGWNDWLQTVVKIVPTSIYPWNNTAGRNKISNLITSKLNTAISSSKYLAKFTSILNSGVFNFGTVQTNPPNCIVKYPQMLPPAPAPAPGACPVQTSLNGVNCDQYIAEKLLPPMANNCQYLQQYMNVDCTGCVCSGGPAPVPVPGPPPTPSPYTPPVKYSCNKSSYTCIKDPNGTLDQASCIEGCIDISDRGARCANSGCTAEDDLKCIEMAGGVLNINQIVTDSPCKDRCMGIDQTQTPICQATNCSDSQCDSSNYNNQGCKQGKPIPCL